MPKKIDGVLYTGKGYLHFPDIPSRDMALAEWETFPAASREAAISQGVFQLGKIPVQADPEIPADPEVNNV